MSDTQSFAGAAVIAPHPAAAAAARDVLIEGGNAIEAAVAALAVVSVVLPQAGGAGGDGLWLIREAGPRGLTRVLDARGPVGDAVTLRHFREREIETIPSVGADAVLTVPGAVAGWRGALELARAQGGKIPVWRLLDPAIALARTGFASPNPAIRPLPPALAEKSDLATLFLEGGQPPKAGTLRRAPGWGETLAYLAQSGLDDFYRGDVGREIARDFDAIGALVSRLDLHHFEPRWREPWGLGSGLGRIEGPPTRATLHCLIALGLFEHLAPAAVESAAHWHGRIEAMKRAGHRVADAQTSDHADLLADAWLRSQSETIDCLRAASEPGLPLSREDSVWTGVIDATGLAVSVVQSIGTVFGAGCLLPGTSLLMGNRGARFELDGDNGLALRRGRRAPMDAVPIVIAGRKGGVTAMGAGMWTVAAGIAAQWSSGQAFAAAIEAPRAIPTDAAESGDAVVMIEEGVDPSVVKVLERYGHEVRPLDRIAAGEASAVRQSPAGRVEAAVDARGDASVEGL